MTLNLAGNIVLLCLSVAAIVLVFAALRRKAVARLPGPVKFGLMAGISFFIAGNIRTCSLVEDGMTMVALIMTTAAFSAVLLLVGYQIKTH